MAQQKSRRANTSAVLKPRIRILVDGEIALGPGKAELLQGIAETGSIAAAASAMGLSYMRAWNLIRTMNACFKQPLVLTARGGSERGGAKLTDTGMHVLRLYQGMARRAQSATRREWTLLQALLRRP